MKNTGHFYAVNKRLLMMTQRNSSKLSLRACSDTRQDYERNLAENVYRYHISQMFSIITRNMQISNMQIRQTNLIYHMRVHVQLSYDV